ncbi:DNA-3-methyladenine glycosylase 2 family protein [Candidatus Gottesmanbacteria bacterium]|nr:DNA-3-methyladenine glycosylase 2 family protein [Candidatus Gottesmanbacteria bacterium]
MYHIVLAHLRAIDPTLYAVGQTVTLEEHVIRSPKHYFSSLCSEIIGQQLSGRVADVLFDRFEKLFSRKRVTPRAVLRRSEETLRSTGMSWSKARFIRDLAQHVLTKSVKLDQLAQLTDEDVIRELIKVKGIGPWTAEMFLMFTLGRQDVFSYGDLGLRNAIKKLYGFKKDPTVKQMERIADKWRPYRTYAARILWKSLDRT